MSTWLESKGGADDSTKWLACRNELPCDEGPEEVYS